MTDLIRAGDPVLYMKVGMHAQESLEDILKRKQREIHTVGYAMWGYGGSSCLPAYVRPFAEECADQGRVIRLVMEPVKSRHAREPVRASHYSLDNEEWELVPSGLDALGSRFALCIANLREVDTELPLGATEVAIGPQRGKLGDEYVRGQTDKACLEVVPRARDGRVASIKLEADLVSPWSVYLQSPD
jgi:hypothetical protein